MQKRKQWATLLSCLTVLIVAGLLSTQNVNAQSCCPQVQMFLEEVSPNPCCFDLYIDRDDMGTPGCEFTKIRLTVLGGSQITSVANGNNSSGSQTSPTTALWIADGGGQYQSFATTYVGQFCLNAGDECGQVFVELFDYMANAWTCSYTLDWCCGTMSCCDNLFIDQHKVSESPCCFELDALINQSIYCRFTKIRGTLAFPGVVLSASSQLGFNSSQAGNVVEWTKDAGTLQPGTTPFGGLCIEAPSGCEDFTLEFYDTEAQAWICEQTIELCCHGAANAVTTVEPLQRADGLALGVHPNPANDLATVKLETKKSGTLRLELFDLEGRSIQVLMHEFRSSGAHSIEVSTAEITSGQYILRLSAANGRVVSMPLTIVR